LAAVQLTIDQALQQAIDAHKAGKLQDAERLYRAILGAQPGHPDANHNLGILAVGAGRAPEGLPYLKVALDANRQHAQFWISYINALIEAGQEAEAVTVLQQGKGLGLPGALTAPLEQKLDDRKRKSPRTGRAGLQKQLDALLAACSARDDSLAVERATAFTRTFPEHALGWKLFGSLLQRTGRLEDAVSANRKAIQLDPRDCEAHCSLGNALKKCGRLADAEASYREALRLAPSHADAHYNLANTLRSLGRVAEAEAHYREVLRGKPDFADAHNNLGNMLRSLGRLAEAEASYREALRIKPGYAEAHYNLGNALKDGGRSAEAQASYREALRIKPDFVDAHSTLLFSLNYAETLPPEATLAEAKRYGAMISTKAQPRFTSWAANPDPDTLRVGFVSGDLRNHPVGYFVEGLIPQLQRQNIELYAFPTMAAADELTCRIAPHFREWVPLHGMRDPDAARAIHARGIQVLIDLSGHTAHNRLPVFACRPAPVQVSWLGYFATTGVPEIDYFIGDPQMSPLSEAQHFTETLWNLPDTWLCLAPPAQAVAITRLPATANGHVTFGCFGNLSKMNDVVVMVWASILRRVPNSLLFLKSKPLAEAGVLADVRRRFAEQGIDHERLQLEGRSPRSEYYAAYNRIDLVLDTFPYPGGTTSVDALWMGVPVLTLKGDRFLSHLGESIATNAGQSDWIAQSPDDYVAKAVAFASDLQGLAELRATLRERVLQTPLFDTDRFARAFAQALRGMWQQRHPSGIKGAE
jgi:predicted O-linked N-acetylglucosamine transferase (SPINDLY family)